MHLEQEVQFPLTGCAGAPLRGAFSLWSRDNRHGIVSSVSLTCALQELESMPYLFHRSCLKSFAERLPLRGSWPEGPDRAEMESGGQRFVSSPASRELPFRGEPFCVWIETIGMGSFHQSVSHVPAVIDELTRLRFAPAPSQHLRGW